MLDRKIILLSRVITPNSHGEQVPSYITLATTFAEKVYKRGGEQTVAAQQVGVTVETFRIRYRPNITQVNAITYAGEQWDVRSIQEEGRKVYLLLECEKKDSE